MKDPLQLIADSGATKTEWRVVKGESVQAVHTAGFNPNVQSLAWFRAELQETLLPKLVSLGADKPKAVHFYGAGLATPKLGEPMNQLLLGLFPSARVAVEHDLLAAARALAGKAPGLVCILGTGSNSCLYDGAAIVAHRGGQGYLLGDEGSGAHLGKCLLAALLDGDLSPAIIKAFEAHTGEALLEIRSAVYASLQPNLALAAFTPFLLRHAREPMVSALIADAFQLFLHKTVLGYESYGSYPLYFTGSVAHHFQAILLTVCTELGLKPIAILQHPIEGLVRYHQELSS